MFKTYIISKIFSTIPQKLKLSFNELSTDTINYNKNAFQARYRHFSAFSFQNGAYKLHGAGLNNFNHKKDYHTEHSPVGLAPIDNSLTEIISEILSEISDTLPINNEEYLVGVNQIRVIANNENMGMPAPSLHQDGSDFSCHINISRKNVSGGNSILSKSKDPKDVFLECTLQPHDYVFFNDRKLYHTATPVTSRIGGHETHRDMFILDYIKR